MKALLILACIGVAANLLGRWLILRSDGSLPRPWRAALCSLPGAELAFIILRWERAAAGSLFCALSLTLLLPLGGQLLFSSSVATREGRGGFVLVSEVRKLVQKNPESGGASQHAAEREKMIASKTAKVEELSSYLQEWYRMLERRRGGLTPDRSEEMRSFNEDAAAYHGLLEASKVELAELERMKAAR